MKPTEKIVSFVTAKLVMNGFGGLYFPGECGCEVGDLAHCGRVEHTEGEPYMNGCCAGYKHVDPRSKFGDFVITATPVPPTDEEFDAYLSY